MRAKLIVVTSCVGLLAACRSQPVAPPQWSDPSPHTEGFITIPDGRLNYLDWGGTGPYLILIHGMGDNPHAFDDLAMPLRAQFHVVAYARRGHGRSTMKGPFNTATFVADLTALMDSLGIKKAHLAGWSMGGNEITGMAGAHPERVGRIVYLDAGYDWADSAFVSAFQEAPVGLAAPAEAYASLNAYRAWLRSAWFPGVVDSNKVEAYIRGLLEAQPDGTVRPLMSDSVAALVFQALATNHRDYTKVKVPALAIYATTFFDIAAGDSARQARTKSWEAQHLTPFRAKSIARITKEIATIDTVTVPGTHADFVFNGRDQVAAAMVKFLSAP